ncbi:MAG: acyl-CoA thioesterase [Thermodesulfobacteriota bacterium]
MQGRPVRASKITFTQLMTAQDANLAGNVHGGVVMKHIDNAAGVVAARHAQSNVVTASIDRLDFHNPAFIGNLLLVQASLNMVGRSSMEIGVRVESEDMFTGRRRHTASAYLTFVALDEQFKPKEVPPLILETDDEKRRNREALARRNVRLVEKRKEKACQRDNVACD